MEIPVYFFCIGDFETPGLQNIVDHCGGDIYEVTTLSDFSETLKIPTSDFLVGETDSDYDGIPDVIELYGVPLANGQLIYNCDPQSKHSDGDGIEDGEEIDPELQYCPIDLSFGGKQYFVKGYYFHMNSNPMLEDTDGDGYWDQYDPEPTNNNVKVTRLKSDYIQVDYSTAPSNYRDYDWENHNPDTDNRYLSYGGNQEWFEMIDDLYDYELLAGKGCGLIAMSDLLIYLSRKDTKFKSELTERFNLGNPISFTDYIDFVTSFDAHFVKLQQLEIVYNEIHFPTPANNIDLFKGFMLDDYFSSYNIPLTGRWGGFEDSFSDYETAKELRDKYIKDMLQNDIPVIASVGDLFDDESLPVLVYDMVLNETCGRTLRCVDHTKIHNHYFTITAIIEDEIKLKNNEYDAVLYEISSWGQKYYILESEIDYYINFSSSPLFTNVLIVEENK